MVDTGGFEGEDAKFFEGLKAALEKDTYMEHRVHILRMLHSSASPAPWGVETTMLRMGMRSSLDSELRSPGGAADTIVRLLDTLAAFARQGVGMEEWFFGVLEGVATRPEALVTFSKYALMGTIAPVSQGHVEAPGGSDESEVGIDVHPPSAGQERDPASGRSYLGGEYGFESSDEAACLSTGEVYV